MKKVYLGIFIAFFAIIAMSHNAIAITPVIDLNNYELYRNVIYPVNDCTFTNGENYFTGRDSFCRVTVRNFTTITSIKTHDTYAVKKGDIVNYYLFVYTSSNPVNFLPKLENISNNFLGWDLISFNAVAIQDYINYSNTTGNLYQYDSANLSLTDTENNYYSVYRIYELTMRANQDGNLNVGLNTIGGIFSMPIEDFGVDFVYSIKFLKWFRQGESSEDAAAKKDLESTENIENQTPPSSSEIGDGAQATNLINAFGGFVTALGGLSATNCNLTLNFPEFAGGSRVVNVCQNKDKAGNIISVFSSLTLIVFYVPLAIRLLTMIYNEIRSFTNG